MARDYAKNDRLGLARHVERVVGERLMLEGSRYDRQQEAGGLLNTVRLIYDSLSTKGIRYAPVPFNAFEQLQTIRTASNVLGQREGNCLDLAVLFCGACLGYDLLPVIVMLEGHALAAVSVKNDLNEWNSPARSLGQLLMEGPLTDEEALRGLVENGEYAAVECTGFASVRRMPGEMPEAKGRTADGLMTFERAVEAGRQQLGLDERPLHFALDIASAHLGLKIEPYPLERPAALGGISVGKGMKIEGKLNKAALVITDGDTAPKLSPGQHEVLTDAELKEGGEIDEAAGIIHRGNSK